MAVQEKIWKSKYAVIRTVEIPLNDSKKIQINASDNFRTINSSLIDEIAQVVVDYFLYQNAKKVQTLDSKNKKNKFYLGIDNSKSQYREEASNHLVSLLKKDKKFKDSVWQMQESIAKYAKFEAKHPVDGSSILPNKFKRNGERVADVKKEMLSLFHQIVTNDYSSKLGRIVKRAENDGVRAGIVQQSEEMVTQYSTTNGKMNSAKKLFYSGLSKLIKAETVIINFGRKRLKIEAPWLNSLSNHAQPPQSNMTR